MDDELKEKIIKDFKDNRSIYEAFSNKVETLIKEILKESKVSVHSVTSRTKEIKSFKDKIYKEKEDYKEFTDVKDISGTRIICLFSEQVDKIAKIIEENFKVFPNLSVDKRKIMDPDRFGYLSIHYVVKLSEERAKLPEFNRYSDLFCEIQIRSILQHAWAEIEHDLGYKSKIEIPKKIRRRFYRLAGLLELGDDEFDRLKLDIKEYKKKVNKDIIEKSENVLLDKISMNTFVNRSEIIKEIDKKIADIHQSKIRKSDASDNLKITKFFHINTINELEKNLKDNKSKIIKFAKEWLGIFDSNKGGFFPNGISIFYLGYALIIKTKNPIMIKRYIKDLNLSQEAYKELIKRI